MRYCTTIIVVLLAALAPAYGAVDQELLRLVPPGSKVITSVAVDQAKNSPFGQYILNRINTQDHDFEDLIRETGFDPRRDLKDFVFATPGPTTSGPRPEFVLFARGNFDQDRIAATLSRKGSIVQKYQGTQVFTNLGNDSPHAFAFLTPDIVAIGNLATVEQAIANRANGTAPDPAIERLVSSVGPNNDAWFISGMPGSFLASHINSGTGNQAVPAQALNSIQESSGGIQFGDIVRLSFDATTRSPKDAQSVVDVVRFLGSMVQMNREKGPGVDGLASALDQMTLQTDAEAVHVALSIPEKSLEQLADMGVGIGMNAHGPAHR